MPSRYDMAAWTMQSTLRSVAWPGLAWPGLAWPRLAWPRHASPRHASPRLASPRHASPRLASPRLASLRFAPSPRLASRHVTLRAHVRSCLVVVLSKSLRCQCFVVRSIFIFCEFEVCSIQWLPFHVTDCFVTKSVWLAQVLY